MRREYMDAIEQSRVVRELSQNFGQLRAKVLRLVEARLPVLHLTPQVCTRIEPEAGGVVRLVTRCVQIMQAVGESVEGVGIRGDDLPWLETTEQYPRALLAACASGLGRDG